MATSRKESSKEPAARRAGKRVELRLSALCHFEKHDPFEAKVVNISRSGALLDSTDLEVLTSIRPQTGTPLTVELQVPGSSESIELTGSVVRHTETGFAIRFLWLPDELTQLLDQFDE